VLESPSALVAVATAFGGGPMTDPQIEREAATAWLEELAAGIPGAAAVLLDGEPAPAVQAWARETGADLIVAARHHGLVERMLIGSFAAQVTQHAPCPVLLVPPRQEARP
jgi:nucleotide-binding universal stress UspA family protein